MNLIYDFLGIISSGLSLYSLLCAIHIFITWVPSLNYSAFGKILSQICDPWLNIFRKFFSVKNLRLDFSPILAISILILASTVLKQVSLSRRFSLIFIIVVLLQIFWSIVSSVFTFFNILVTIRLIAELVKKTVNPIWYSIDQILNPVVYKISRFFFRNRFVRPASALAVTLLCGILIQITIGFSISRLYLYFGS